MSKYLSALCICISLVNTTALAADLGAGQSLVQQNCQSCHDSSVYTRPDRKIDSLMALNRQVKRCELSLGLTWFDEQVEDVVHYLNTTYYNFK